MSQIYRLELPPIIVLRAISFMTAQTFKRFVKSDPRWIRELELKPGVLYCADVVRLRKRGGAFIAPFCRVSLFAEDVEQFRAQTRCRRVGSVHAVHLNGLPPLSLKRGDFPPNLCILDLGRFFNQPLEEGVLPQSLKILRLGCFNKGFEKGVLPTHLHTLDFLFGNAAPLREGVLPPHLCVLKLGWWFDAHLSRGVLPASLKTLNLGACFNKPLEAGVLPETLQTLVFSREFNQPLAPGVLPSSLKTLRFGDYFDLPLQPGTLPLKLYQVSFGTMFKHPLGAGVLPPNLRVLMFSRFDYYEVLDACVLPQSITAVKVCGKSHKHYFMWKRVIDRTWERERKHSKSQ